jgi:phenylacetate-CoA ligase
LEVLEKSTVKAAANEFVSEAVPPGQRMMVSTSGTTGSPLQVTASKDAVAVNFAFFSDFLYRCGLDPFERSVTFAGRLVVPNSQEGPPYWRCNYAMRTWLFSSYHISERNAPHYIAQLRKVKPAYIDSYPSAVYALSKYIVDNNIVLGFALKGIVTSSETLTADQRSVIERAFGCKVYDQYGCAEMAAFVYQCRMGGYHIHPLYGVFEVLDADGRPCAPGVEGDVVLTGLINDAMPLLRYRIGDRAITADAPCACGSAHPAVKRIVGREDDYIVTPEGNLVGRLDPLFKGLVGISEAQIVQRSLREIAVLVVPQPNFDESSVEGLVTGLRERVGAQMSVKVEVVNQIPRGSGGKFRSVISTVWGERRRQDQSRQTPL